MFLFQKRSRYVNSVDLFYHKVVDYKKLVLFFTMIYIHISISVIFIKMFPTKVYSSKFPYTPLVYFLFIRFITAIFRDLDVFFRSFYFVICPGFITRHFCFSKSKSKKDLNPFAAHISFRLLWISLKSLKEPPYPLFEGTTRHKTLQSLEII